MAVTAERDGARVAHYVWTVARTLAADVRPVVEGDAAVRDILANCIHILTAVANALEPEGAETLPSDEGAPRDVLRSGVPESIAAYRDASAAVAAAARRIDASAAAIDEPDVRDVIEWEARMADAAIARMDAIENATGEIVQDPALNIDSDALAAYLRRRWDAPGLRITRFQLMIGGRSRQTALFAIEGAPGRPAELVVQRNLPGLLPPPSFATPAAEYEALRTFHAAGLKVPTPLLCESDIGPLGAAFTVVERARGSVVERDYWRVPENGSVAIDLAEQMALLHAQPIDALSPILPHARERYDRAGWEEELDRLAGAWHGSAHWPSAGMSAAIAWMRRNIDCVENRRTFVHNDMVFHNILAEGDSITAILDWEQIAIGHPAEDLGYCYPYVSRMIDWQVFMDSYVAAGGQRVSQRQIDYFALRALLRLMNLLVGGGRNAYEHGRGDNVLLASAAAFFTQRLTHRMLSVLSNVLGRG